MAVRPHPLDWARWWDWTWNTVFGCRPLSPGCLNCYAAACALLQIATEIPFYRDTTYLKRGRYTFNGNVKVLPPEHPLWTLPLRWKGARDPLLGAGMPSLCFVSSMNE